MSKLPEKVRDILDKRCFVHIATLMPDGSPQVSPTWVDRDGDIILVNSAEGRVKDANLKRDPRVALSCTDPDNDYQAIMIRGRVIEATTDGADAHIDKLAKKYLGQDRYPYRQHGEVRVLYRIEADKIRALR